MNMIWMLLAMLVAFWLLNTFARRQQQKMADQQAARVEEAMVPGTWVRTRAGFYGTVVEVDGDVVTLATPLGDESLWAKNAIVGAEEPPFASALGDGEQIEPGGAESAQPLEDPADEHKGSVETDGVTDASAER